MTEEKLWLYRKLEEMRNSKLIVYFTGDRAGWETQIGNDATDFFMDHLDKIGVVPKISLFLYTNGGATLAGWNIINLIRQFCDDLEIIVPSKARSTGTLMCLGANRIIMTKQATLGPIDPSVNTPLNPEIPGAGPQARYPVSVEAVKGFFELARHELSIESDESLAKIFGMLTEKVHPLVLGDVYRTIGQIQMLAERLLIHQVNDQEKIKKIINFLCSESGSHDYTINRREAAENLGLNIEKPDDVLYNVIKRTYDMIVAELQIRDVFDPNIYIGQAMQQRYQIRRLFIESITGGSDVFLSEGVLSRMSIPSDPPQEAIHDQRVYEGWRHYE